jgi:hypothetical protein
MKTKKDIKILFENGLTFSTIKNLTPNQVKVLVEKFTKKDEPTEAFQVTNVPAMKKVTGTVEDLKKTGLKVDGEVSIDPSTGLVTAITKEGEMSEESQELDEKFASKAQQKLFFVKCGNGKTKEQKKWCKLRDEFASSTTKKDYKKMSEKLHPEKTVPVKKRKSIKEEEYEKFLENRIVSLIERHTDPEMTKGELIQTIMEKVNKSENFVLRNPKKNTMFQPKGKMTKPIGNLYSISGEMKEDTKEKERTKTRPDTDKKEKDKGRERKNPFEPKHNPKPKAGDTKEKERTKPDTDTDKKEKDKGRERKNPFEPKHNPKPKAKSDELKEMYGTETAPTPVKKPGTKEKSPGKGTPFQPKHNPKPKAGKSNIPSWLSWNKLGVKLK